MRVVTDYVVGAGGAAVGSAVWVEKLTGLVDLAGSGLGLVLVVLSIGLVVHRRRLTALEMAAAKRAESAAREAEQAAGEARRRGEPPEQRKEDSNG